MDFNQSGAASNKPNVLIQLPQEHHLSVAVSMERKLRMVVLGASRTGKTQLMSRFMGKDFSDTYMPTVEEYYRKMYTIRGKTYLLDILETSGMNSNSINQKLNLMTGDVYLIVYDITNLASFESAKELAVMTERSVKVLANESRHNLSGIRHWNCRRKSPLSVPVIIAGNKSDLEDERQVRLEEVTDWVRDSATEFSHTRLVHIEVSAKDLFSVQRLFEIVFSTAQLPVEMSPTMHRKVSENTFLTDTSKVQQLHKHDRHSPKFLHRWKSHQDSDKSSNTDPFHNSVPQSDPSTESATSSEAFAAVCEDLRRPSATTEMLTAMKKAKSTQHGHYLPKETFAPFQKLKQKISRVTSSHI